MEKRIPVLNGRQLEEKPEFSVIDKRLFAGGDSAPKEAQEKESPRYPTFVEELIAKLAAVEQRFEEKKREIHSEITRTKARLEADAQRNVQLEKQKMLIPFLEVLDNLDRAIEAVSKGGTLERLLEGVRMTANLFRANLQAMGVEPIAVLEQTFDPNIGQAVGMVPVEDEKRDGVVVDVLAQGYRLGDNLLRPAQVRVGVKANPGSNTSY